MALPNTLFTVRHALASPLLHIRGFKAQPVSADLHIVQVQVENLGYLATNLTDQARNLGKGGDITIELDLDLDCELLMGQPVVTLGDLAGREERRMPYDPWRRPWGEPAGRAEWLVRGAGASRITVHARSTKAGSCSAHATLDDLQNGDSNQQ